VWIPNRRLLIIIKEKVNFILFRLLLFFRKLDYIFFIFFLFFLNNLLRLKNQLFFHHHIGIFLIWKKVLDHLILLDNLAVIDDHYVIAVQEFLQVGALYRI
jgi:hypothetical protein